MPRVLERTRHNAWGAIHLYTLCLIEIEKEVLQGHRLDLLGRPRIRSMSYDPLVSGPTHFVDTFRVLSAANLRRCAQYSVRAHDLDLEPGDWNRVLSIVCADMCLDLTTAHAMKRNANKAKSTVQRMTRAF